MENKYAKFHALQQTSKNLNRNRFHHLPSWDIPFRHIPEIRSFSETGKVIPAISLIKKSMRFVQIQLHDESPQRYHYKQTECLPCVLFCHQLLRWKRPIHNDHSGQEPCLLYTSDADDDLLCVDLGGRR